MTPEEQEEAILEFVRLLGMTRQEDEVVIAAAEAGGDVMDLG